ncbi:serine hydrolase-like protein [Ceratina calcarata]|uniref:Serine hydrolase-like protein n=1 Tax=Ceratina calcarata TaxID=156304 RepID=A0AAJ7JAH3_9HYME|nr:serine hydrolase-like protein [Ceratina calcarata]
MKAEEVKLPVPWGYIAAKIYGPPMEKKALLVHGILDNAGTFNRLIGYLPRGYQYVSIDLPGHGLSSHFPPGKPLHFFDYMYSIFLVLEALKWKTCVYIAHSFGAHIGTYFSIVYPNRLEKIVTFDGFNPFFMDDPVSDIKKMYDLESYSKESTRLYSKDEALFAMQFLRMEVLTMEAAEALFQRAVTKIDNLYKYNRDTRLRYFMKPFILEEQHREIYSKYCTKTLIITIEHSHRISSKIIEVIDKDLLTLVIVKGNHDVHNNSPETVAPYVCKFLDDNLRSKL